MKKWYLKEIFHTVSGRSLTRENFDSGREATVGVDFMAWVLRARGCKVKSFWISDMGKFEISFQYRFEIKRDVWRLSFTCGTLLVKRGFDFSPAPTIGGRFAMTTSGRFFVLQMSNTTQLGILPCLQALSTRNCVGVVVAYSLVNRWVKSTPQLRDQKFKFWSKLFFLSLINIAS